MKKQLLKNKKGQSTVEYLLVIMVVVIVISAVGAKIPKLMTDVTDTVFKNVNAKIGTLMKSSNGN